MKIKYEITTISINFYLWGEGEEKREKYKPTHLLTCTFSFIFMLVRFKNILVSRAGPIILYFE